MRGTPEGRPHADPAEQDDERRDQDRPHHHGVENHSDGHQQGDLPELLQTMATEVDDIAQAANGHYASQVNGLKSALATLRSRLTQLSHGTASASSVTNAARNVQARTNDLTTATRSACPSAEVHPSENSDAPKGELTRWLVTWYVYLPGYRHYRAQ